MQFHVPTVTCGHCVRTITRTIQALDPQARVEVDLDALRLDVISDLSADQIIEALAAQDYPAKPLAVTALAAPARGGCCGTCDG